MFLLVSNTEFGRIFKKLMLCQSFCRVFGGLIGVKTEVLLYMEIALPDSPSIQPGCLTFPAARTDLITQTPLSEVQLIQIKSMDKDKFNGTAIVEIIDNTVLPLFTKRSGEIIFEFMDKVIQIEWIF